MRRIKYIPKHNTNKGMFFWFQWYDILFLLFVWAGYYFFYIKPTYGGSDGWIQQSLYPVYISAILIFKIPDYNRRVITVIYKYLDFYLFKDHRYRFRQKGDKKHYYVKLENKTNR